MKSFCLGLTLVVLGVSFEARAQQYIDDEVAYVAVGLDLAFALGGITTGIGSTAMEAKGKVNRHWFAASYTMATFNLALSCLWFYGSEAVGPHGTGNGMNPWMNAIALTHAAIAVWNVVVPTLALVRGDRSDTPPTSFAPVVLGGRDAAGHRWSGLGVQVVGF